MRVVVTGMGVVSPVGNDLDTFWTNLKNGVCGIERIDDPQADLLPAKVWAKVKDFNPSAYGIAPAIARRQELFTLYALAAAAQAMEQSGLVAADKLSPESGAALKASADKLASADDSQISSPLANIESSRLGVYMGSGIGGFDLIRRESVKNHTDGPKWVSPTLVPSMITNAAAGHIAIRFNAKGPAFSLSTACATGTHCIGEAYRAIKYGYADAIIAGGSEAANIPMAVAAFGNMRALSKSDDPTRACVPFSADRDGFVIGEGAAALVLESYAHAVKRGAVILAEVVGYGNSCDAYHMTAPRPDATTQAAAIKDALRQAGYCGRRDVLHINAHGTSTPMNDSAETAAFHLALGRNASKAHICSTKSMTGHLLGGAGAVEAVAAVMALREGIVPPTIGLDNPDPACDLNYTPNKAVKAPLTISLSDSLGFGGHNAAVAFRSVAV